MKTVHFFAFYPHNLLKITFFATWSSMNPKNTKSLHFDGWRMGVLCCLSIFQVVNQSFSNLRFHTFEILILLLWWFTPTFTIRWFNITWIPMNIVLILFLPLIAILSCREYEIFRPGKWLFPAERILCSLREPTTFLTRMKCIPVKREVYSRKKCTCFS